VVNKIVSLATIEVGLSNVVAPSVGQNMVKIDWSERYGNITHSSYSSAELARVGAAMSAMEIMVANFIFKMRGVWNFEERMKRKNDQALCRLYLDCGGLRPAKESTSIAALFILTGTSA